MKKKIAAILTSFALAASMISIPAFAEEAHAAARYYINSSNISSKVPAINQFSLGLNAGCEVVASSALLQACGYNVSPHTLANKYMSYSSYGDFVNHYSGNPYTGGTAYAPAVGKMINSYLGSVNANTANLGRPGGKLSVNSERNVPLDKLLEFANNGTPCLVWHTMEQQWPAYTWRWSNGYNFVTNEHCLVLIGGDHNGLTVMDPMTGTYRLRGYDWFNTIYEAMGSMSVRLCVVY